jgi:hypothetical protein
LADLGHDRLAPDQNAAANMSGLLLAVFLWLYPAA